MGAWDMVEKLGRHTRPGTELWGYGGPGRGGPAQVEDGLQERGRRPGGPEGGWSGGQGRVRVSWARVLGSHGVGGEQKGRGLM